MRNRDIAQIREDLQELVNVRESLEDAISKFLADISLIEKELDKEYSVGHILGQTRSTLEGIDVDTLFDFVDDLEAEIGTLSYKEKRVTEANKISMFPKNLSPSFYRPVSNQHFQEMTMNFSDPKFLKVVEHAALLILLTVLSASIGPVYTLIVGALTATTPTLPLWVQQFLPLVLPIIGALVTKFQDEIKKELQDQENDKLAAKNIQLLHENTLMAKTLAKSIPMSGELPATTTNLATTDSVESKFILASEVPPEE